MDALLHISLMIITVLLCVLALMIANTSPAHGATLVLDALAGPLANTTPGQCPSGFRTGMSGCPLVQTPAISASAPQDVPRFLWNPSGILAADGDIAPHAVNLTATEQQTAVVTWAARVFNANAVGGSSIQFSYRVYWATATGSFTLLAQVAGNCPARQWCGNDVTFPMIAAALPATAKRLSVYVSLGALGAVAYPLPLTVTYTADGGGSGGSGGSTPEPYQGDGVIFINNPGAPALLDAINDIDAVVKNPVCSNGQSLVGKVNKIADTAASVGTFVSGLFGGGASVAVLLKMLKDGKKQIETQREQLCNALEQTGKLTDIDGLLRNPAPVIKILTDIAMRDPKAAPIAQQAAAKLDAFPTGADNLVTAANKQNELLKAAIQIQAEGNDRLTGGKKEDFETRDGPRLTKERIAAGGPGTAGAEFGEGDYAGTYDRLRELVPDDLRPDYAKGADLAPGLEGVQSCFAQYGARVAAEEDEATIEAAFERLKWNARQIWAGSPLGEAVCKVTVRPPRTYSEICFGPADGLSINLGDAGGVLQLVEANGLCVHGPNAPPYIVQLLGYLPVILLATAIFGGIRMFI